MIVPYGLCIVLLVLSSLAAEKQSPIALQLDAKERQLEELYADVLLLHLSRGLRDDELHVLAVTAKRIIGDAIAAGNRLELLAAQQSLIHTIAPMMHTYCAGACH